MLINKLLHDTFISSTNPAEIDDGNSSRSLMDIKIAGALLKCK